LPREFSFFVTERTDGVFASCATQADPHPPRQQRAVAWRIKTQMGARPPVRPNNLAAPILSPCHHCQPSPQPQRASAGTSSAAYGFFVDPEPSTFAPRLSSTITPINLAPPQRCVFCPPSISPDRKQGSPRPALI